MAGGAAPAAIARGQDPGEERQQQDRASRAEESRRTNHGGLGLEGGEGAHSLTLTPLLRLFGWGLLPPPTTTRGP